MYMYVEVQMWLLQLYYETWCRFRLRDIITETKGFTMADWQRYFPRFFNLILSGFVLWKGSLNWKKNGLQQPHQNVMCQCARQPDWCQSAVCLRSSFNLICRWQNVLSRCTVKSDAPVPCGRGFYASEGSMSCDECPVGYYCPLLTTPIPQPCPSGFYANETTSTSCTECDRGMLFVVLLFFVCPCSDFTMVNYVCGYNVGWSEGHESLKNNYCIVFV